ncbi:MAG TPA: malto-oligosyltrehalose synthase [Actinomycetota bacterium]|nr:malto-oligosyltrehalose synthase [Actinomycetota bacterium]
MSHEDGESHEQTGSATAKRATYRLQLHPGFGFEDAARIAPYLASLGVTHLYLSPILQARRGSDHGYDVVDHGMLNEDLGGAEAFGRLVDAWNGGIVVDIVPNHMAVTERRNGWWWDVLKHGPDSRYARCFDIDWDPPEAKLGRAILVPILGDHYGRVLEAGELVLGWDGEEPVLRYYEHALPLAPGSVPDDVEAVNTDVDRLHAVLEQQHYRLAYWKVAGQELNYRRFFAINELAAIRAEDADVFEATHRLLLELASRGDIDGFRVDHIDGLRYPAEYLERLDEASGRSTVVEKILEGSEELPATWPVDGTTGYEFLNRVGGLFIDPDAEKRMSETYETFTGHAPPIELAMLESKALLMETELAADVERLTDLFVAVCENQRRYRDFTRSELRQTLRETLASLAVYRTYVDDRTNEVTEHDRDIIRRACDDAATRRSDLDPELFTFLCSILSLDVDDEPARELAIRFQQTSGPVMAKGIEDTFFYRYNRAIALNEVGGDPATFGVSPETFHHFNLRTQAKWPGTMLATSTHDTKRSEDVRARLALLSEIPDDWAAAVERWSGVAARYREADFDDRNTEYALYQTLVGAWPLPVERALGYVMKSAREAKVHTSWLAPDERYEASLRSLVEGLLGDAEFTDDVASFAGRLAEPGRVNSLAQTLLKLTSPGVPDLYQGSELWDLSLVDPDNRRPVDYEERARVLDEVESGGAARAMQLADRGGPKIFVISRSLAVRARVPEAFGAAGTYEPLAGHGRRGDNVVAYARAGRVITVVPRLVLSLEGGWDDTHLDLPRGRWRNTFTDEEFDAAVPLGQLLDSFPVGLLVKEDA